MLFADLQLAEPILRAIQSKNYTTATPIQAQAIPPILAGTDVLGCAQTGTGKTAAFALPILHRLASTQRSGLLPRCLVLAPTRELATQITTSFAEYGRNLRLKLAAIYGGVSQVPQVRALRQGIDVLVATPGRLLDLMEQGHIHLDAVQTLVLDEADRMLDMGFAEPIREIVAEVPQQRQTLLFSATMPPEIRKMAHDLLRDPVTLQLTPVTHTADKVEQCVYFVSRENKLPLLAHLVKQHTIERAVVFMRTKHGAERLAGKLESRGISAEAIHGDKTQAARQRALEAFRNSRVKLLIATDVAARGLDIQGVTHVINYDLTHEPETYVHRIGRTARAGKSGLAISFCDKSEELGWLRQIERLLKKSIPVRDDLPEFPPAAVSNVYRPASAGTQQQQGDAKPHPKGEHRPAKPARPQFAAHNHEQGRPAARKPQFSRSSGDAGHSQGRKPQGPSGHPAQGHGKPKFAGFKEHVGRGVKRAGTGDQTHAAGQPTGKKPHRKGPKPTRPASPRD